MRFTDNAAITTDNMATDDILAGTDVSASADKKFSLANLANWFLNKFTGLSLAGSQQTVKSALDSLNSNLTDFAGWRTGGSFNNYRRTGLFMLNNATEAPTTSVTTYALIVVTSAPITSGTDSSTAKQIAFTVNGIGWWTRQYVGGNWSAWTQM